MSMERRNRLEAIQEGKFLSLRSDVSVNSYDELPDSNERPYVIPEHDPEGSIYRSRQSRYLAAKNSSSQLTCTSSENIEATVGQHGGKKPMEPHVPLENLHLPALRDGPNNAGLPNNPTNPPPYFLPPPRPPRPGTLGGRTAARISRFSITPSMADAGCLPPNLTRPQYFDTIVTQEPGKISPMHIVKLPSQPDPDPAPPDGGTLAWLQVLAGFFVIMDAQ